MPLRQLYPHAKTPDRGPPKVDIIAVHGLNPRSRDDTAHAWDTWRTPRGESGRLWLRDDLPQHLPDARIFLFEYNSTAVYGKDRDTFLGKADELLEAIRINRKDAELRPILLLGHSMGGLLIKQALVNAHNNPQYTAIISATSGLAFFATPHHGGDTKAVGLGKMASKTAIKLRLQRGDDILKVLDNKSTFSDVLGEHWRHQALKYDIVSFWGALDNVVPMHSARLGIAGDREHIVKLNADHRQVCKFGDSATDRANFELVRCNLEDLYKKALQRHNHITMPSATPSKQEWSSSKDMLQESLSKLDISDNTPSAQAHKPHYYIPFMRNKHFVGRESTLQTLQNMFFDEDNQKVALVGLGGIGKTQVALKLAYWVKDNKQDFSVFWVPALSHASFESAYTEIAREVSINITGDKDSAKDSVKRYLSSENAGPWLLIVDNADDIDLLFGSTEGASGINQYLPESELGLMLFTTRSMDVAMATTNSSIVELHDMSLQEATSLFEKSLICKGTTNYTGVPELLHQLNYLPLAIIQATAYLNRNGVSVARYMQLLQGTEADMISLLQREFYDNTRYRESQHGVATTWLISFDQIRKSDENAAEILSFISRIEPKAIPFSILPKFEREEQSEHAIGTLCAYAFLTQREDADVFDMHSRVYDMHSLVHLAIRIWLQTTGLEERTADTAIEHMYDIFPSADWENRFLWRQYLPHALRLLGGNGALDAERKSVLRWAVAACLQEDGRYREAVSQSEQRCRWVEIHYDEDHPTRLAAQHNLARHYENNGEIKKAMVILERVVEIRQRTLREDDPDRLVSEHLLAMIYREDGQVQRAIELMERVREIYVRMQGEDSPDALSSSHELATQYAQVGRVDQAIALLEHVVAVGESTLPKDHPHQLTSQHNLARCYSDNNEVEKAVPLLQHVVAVKEGALSQDHPERLKSQHELARVYLEMNNVGLALPLLQHVVAIHERTLPEDHSERLASQHELARAYLQKNDVEEAIHILQHVVAVEEKTLDEDDPGRRLSVDLLASALEQAGQDGVTP